MKKSFAASVGLTTALLLSACGGNTPAAEEANNSALVDFDASAGENVILQNDSGTADGNFAVTTNSLDNATAGDGNTL